MAVLWLVVARSGSKGCPGKNSRLLAGRSLIGWKIDGAKAAMAEGDVMAISTDSEAYQDIAVSHGAIAPFLRPPELATDEATSASVVLHALAEMRKHAMEFDKVMLLEASAPFTRPWHYEAALNMMSGQAVDAVIGVKFALHPAFVGPADSEGKISEVARQISALQRSRRQDMPTMVTPCASLYLARTGMFEKTHSFYGSDLTYGLPVAFPWNLEIDTPEDWLLAEFAVEKNLVG